MNTTMNRESKDVIIDKVSQYLHWLTIPKKEFGNMPICPYLDTELRKEQLYLDIWYPHQCSFMDITTFNFKYLCCQISKNILRNYICCFCVIINSKVLLNPFK